MRLKKVALYGLVLVAFVWVSLFGDWLPIPVQTVLFATVLMLGLVMIVAGWWGWIKSRQTEDVPRWRKVVGLVGVTANTVRRFHFGSMTPSTRPST
jgi:hypothetical protein